MSHVRGHRIRDIRALWLVRVGGVSLGLATRPHKLTTRNWHGTEHGTGRYHNLSVNITCGLIVPPRGQTSEPTPLPPPTSLPPPTPQWADFRAYPPRSSPQGQSSLLHTLWTPAKTLCVGTLCPLGTIYPLCGHPLPSGHPPAPAPAPTPPTGLTGTVPPFSRYSSSGTSASLPWQTPDATPSTPYPLTYPHPRQTATLPPLPPLLPPTPPRAESRLTG